MARQVYGNITDKTGPLSKLVVEAWDSDPDGDDFMGRATTDKPGDHRIEYAEGHWDPAPHEITTWRPDIYIRVLTKTKNGRDVEVDRSKVYDNQPLRDDRKINLNVGASGTIAKATPLRAETHGLPFINDFSFKVGWTFDGLGFCGGMCAYALNRYNNKTAILAKMELPPSRELLTTQNCSAARSPPYLRQFGHHSSCYSVVCTPGYRSLSFRPAALPRNTHSCVFTWAHVVIF